MGVPRCRSRRESAADQCRWVRGGNLRQRHALRCGRHLLAHWHREDRSCDSHRRRTEDHHTAGLQSGTEKTEVVIRTGAGLKTCRMVEKRSPTFEFEIEMGQPVVGEQLAIETMWVRAVGMRVSMGNPHFVVFVERFQEGWQKQPALIQTQPQFPQGTNVEYVAVRGPNEIDIRLYERGAGETMSSGTGSCASAVAAIASQRVASPVTVIAPGGSQTVRWESQVYLRGPATLICRGEYFV